MTQLEVLDLHKRYGNIVALNGLSFSVVQGQFLTLLGPSGCGKSTTLMTIAGFVDANAGSIRLGGRDITALPPERRGMGVVFQDYALFPHLSVLNNVMFPLRMRGWRRSKAEQKAREMLALVELDEHDAVPAQLSGGQRQRVALARALVFDPAVLLMDEPLSALDRRLRQTMQFELRRIQARTAATVVYVTHDQDEALALSDVVGVMRDGVFEQIGTPDQVYRNPANSFVANFVGESNRMKVKIRARSRDRICATPVNASSATQKPMYASSAPTGLAEGLFIVRPEDIRIRHDDGDDDRSATGLRGQVTDTIFLGDHIRVEVVLEHGDRWTAKLTSQNNGDNRGLDKGRSVRVAWDARAARVVPF
jgi:putative spermidine/putrescine transport system ATP-binding protein